MEQARDETPEDRLYLKGLTVRHERHIGLWLPIVWHLALRAHTGAMIDLANWFSDDNSLEAFGSFADAFSAAGLYRRAYRKGDARAAQHLAMSCFNRNDMTGYRHWLRKAGKAGDTEARRQLSRFETRLSHTAARKIGRLRPEHRRDKFA